MDIFDIISILMPGIALAVGVYQLVNILLATPVDAHIVGYDELEIDRPETGWQTERYPVYRYTIDGEVRTSRSRYIHFLKYIKGLLKGGIDTDGYVDEDRLEEAGMTVRIYVSKTGKVYEKEGVIYSFVIAAVLFFVL